MDRKGEGGKPYASRVVGGVEDHIVPRIVNILVPVDARAGDTAATAENCPGSPSLGECLEHCADVLILDK